MENQVKKHKFEAQDAFWKSIIEKYEARNQELEQEQIELQGRIDQMDASMPAIMAFNMSKLAQSEPNADVGALVKIPCTCNKDTPKERLKIPDLSGVSVFSIEDADVHYMDKIKDLTEQEKKLIDEVNKLRSKEKAIKSTKKKVERLMCEDRQNKTSVDGNELQRMNERLLDENRLLSYEIADLKLEMKHIRETVEGPLARELDRERRKALKLEAELKDKMCQENGRMCTAQREVDFLREQLKTADKNLRDMVEINNKLKAEMGIIEHRMSELQNDLINQKISEATCLAILKSQLAKPGDHGGGQQPPPPPPPGGAGNEGHSCHCLQKPPCSKRGSLYQIARDLSHELKEAEQNKNIPDDLKDTVSQIKSLCDLIDQNICESKEGLQTKFDEGDKETPAEPPRGSTEEIVLSIQELEVPEEKQSLSQPQQSREDVNLEEKDALAKESPPELDQLQEPEEHVDEAEQHDDVPQAELPDAEVQISEEHQPPNEELEPPIEQQPGEEELDQIPEREAKELSSAEIPERESMEKIPHTEEAEKEQTHDATIVDSEFVEQIEGVTELQDTHGDDIQVRKFSDGPNITTTVTRSGVLEVVTEGPAGLIETTLTVTDSGNIEVVTEYTECGEPGADLKKIKSGSGGSGKEFNMEDACKNCGFFRTDHAGVSDSSGASGSFSKCSTEEVTKCSSEQTRVVEEIIIEEELPDEAGEEESTGSSKYSAIMEVESSFVSEEGGGALAAEEGRGDLIQEEDKGDLVPDEFKDDLIAEEDKGDIAEDDKDAPIVEKDSGLVAEEDTGAVVDEDGEGGLDDKDGTVIEDDTGALVADSDEVSKEALSEETEPPQEEAEESIPEKDSIPTEDATPVRDVSSVKDLQEESEAREVEVKDTIDYQEQEEEMPMRESSEVGSIERSNVAESEESEGGGDEASGVKTYGPEDEKVVPVDELEAKQPSESEVEKEVKSEESSISELEEAAVKSKESSLSKLDVQSKEPSITKIEETQIKSKESSLSKMQEVKSKESSKTSIRSKGKSKERILTSLEEIRIRSSATIPEIKKSKESTVSRIEKKSEVIEPDVVEETAYIEEAIEAEATEPLELAEEEVLEKEMDETPIAEEGSLALEEEEEDIASKEEEPPIEEIDEEKDILEPTESETVPIVKASVSLISGGDTTIEEVESVKGITAVVEVSMEETLVNEVTLESESIVEIPEGETEIVKEKGEEDALIDEEEVQVEAETIPEDVFEQKRSSILSVIQEEEIAGVGEKATVEVKVPVELVDVGVLTDTRCDCVAIQTERNRLKQPTIPEEKGLDIASLKQRVSETIAESNLQVLDAIEEAQATLRVSLVESQKRLSETLRVLSQQGAIAPIQEVDEEAITEETEVQLAAEREPIGDEFDIPAAIDEEPEPDFEEIEETEDSELPVLTAVSGDYVSIESQSDKHSESDKGSKKSRASGSETLAGGSGGVSVGGSSKEGGDESAEKVVAKESGSTRKTGDVSVEEVIEAVEEQGSDEDEEWHDADETMIADESGKGDYEMSVSSGPTQDEQVVGFVDDADKSTSDVTKGISNSSRSNKSVSSIGASKTVCARKVELPPCDCGDHPNDCPCIDCISKPTKDEISLDISELSKTCECVGACDCTCDLQRKTCDCKGRCECKTCPTKAPAPPTACTCKGDCNCEKCRFPKQPALPDCDCKVCLCRDCELQPGDEEELLCVCKVCDCEECRFLRAQLGDEFVCDCDVPCDCEECLFLAAKKDKAREVSPETADCKCEFSTAKRMGEKGVPKKDLRDVVDDGKEVYELEPSLRSEGGDVGGEKTESLMGSLQEGDVMSVEQGDGSQISQEDARKYPSELIQEIENTKKASVVENELFKRSGVIEGSKSGRKGAVVLKKESSTISVPVVRGDSKALEKEASEIKQGIEGDSNALQKDASRIKQRVRGDSKNLQKEASEINKGVREESTILAKETSRVAKDRDRASEGVSDVREESMNLRKEGLSKAPKGSSEKIQKDAKGLEVRRKDVSGKRKSEKVCTCPKDKPCRRDCERNDANVKKVATPPLLKYVCTCADEGLPCKDLCKGRNQSKFEKPKEVSKKPSETGSEYGRDVAELQELMEQIKCACQEAEVVAKPPLIKQASDITETLSSLEVALEAMQQKSETKDVLIDALKEELRLRAKGVAFQTLIDDMFTEKENVEDYDRLALAEMLPKPVDEKLMKFGRMPLSCICNVKRVSSEVCECKVSPVPLEINDIRRIGPTSLLIKWIPARSNQVTGYEICVDGLIKSRVFSPRRTSAIVDGLNMKDNVNISLYAICYAGRCQPPATAVYKM